MRFRRPSSSPSGSASESQPREGVAPQHDEPHGPAMRPPRPLPRSPRRDPPSSSHPTTPPRSPSFPPTSFWVPGDDEATGYNPAARDKEAQAHHETLRQLDAQLEALRASPLARPVPVLRYVLYFLFFVLLLSIRDVRVIHAEADAVLSLQRLDPGNEDSRILEIVRLRLQSQPEELANEIGLDPEDILRAREAVDRLARARKSERIGLLDWGLFVRLGDDKAITLNYNIFLNMLYAAGLASVLFLRNRERTQSKLIDRQNRELSILNRRQALEMGETSRLLRVLSRAQSRLLASEKLASIGRLSATLAHEIRNPLGIIASSVGMVAEDIPPSSPSGQALDLVRHEIDRLNKIIIDLLDFARPQVPNPEYYDPNDLVRDWIRPLGEEMAERRIQVLADLDPAPPEILVDADQLYQAFLNLLINAADAADENAGGTIMITTRVEGNELVAIEIHDNGPGIPPALLEQVFEPFYTTKTAGSGLGLAVVKQTIEAMGGTVHLESVEGRGTTARLRLPTGPTSRIPLDADDPDDLAGLPGPAPESPAHPAD